jgi:type IV secretion system protein VirB2
MTRTATFNPAATVPQARCTQAVHRPSAPNWMGRRPATHRRHLSVPARTLSPPNPSEGGPRRGSPWRSVRLGFALALVPFAALAQTSPFETGATALQTNLLTLLTPVAVILVIVLGMMAMVNRISWGWCIAAIAGIAIAFGAPQMVAWIRGAFGV